jgi:hypothetical protein
MADEVLICAGVHGQSIFMRLHYVDQLNLYPIPIGHAALLGVMRNFWAAMFEKPTKGRIPSRHIYFPPLSQFIPPSQTYLP